MLYYMRNPRYDNVLRELPLGRRWATYSPPTRGHESSQRRNEVGGARLALIELIFG